MLSSKYATYHRVPGARENHGFFASPTESEFSEHFDSGLPPKHWDEDRVAEWLRNMNCSKYIELFGMNNINGIVLMELDRPHLRDMGIKKVGDQIRIATQIKLLRNKEYRNSSKANKNRVSLRTLS